ncbi:MAG TPA: hypothetical protein VGQ02_05395 [Candidatus Limnocylindrales bacterium]|jgi:hypothetical protein|nr:hypothetical protein [Candidatus Limnocylindrales bacterium]
MGYRPVPLRLDPGLADGRSVVARHNESGGLVSAHLDGEILVVRPTRQPMVARMPIYYSGRPEFRGKLDRQSNGQVILKGFVQHLGSPVLFNILGGILAPFGAAFGAAIVLSGDLTGVVLILVAAFTGAALFASSVLIGRLSRMDEQTIMTALRAIADEDHEEGDR